MIRLLVGSLLTVASLSASGATLILPLIDVIDGDTLKTVIDLPCPLCTASIRVRGIDTPEKGSLAKCQQERDQAERVTLVMKQLSANSHTMKVTNFVWDKYGGRIVGDVEINGVDVATFLLTQQLAQRYIGRGPKPMWC